MPNPTPRRLTAAELEDVESRLRPNRLSQMHGADVSEYEVACLLAERTALREALRDLRECVDVYGFTTPDPPELEMLVARAQALLEEA